MRDDERIAREICAHSLSGFCQNVGGDLGCKAGRGEAPSGKLCVATLDQLGMSGNLETAQAVIHALRFPSSP